MTPRPALVLFGLALWLGSAQAAAGDAGDDPGAPEARNRLAGASSPYLLGHADDPVDWYPWGDEAFARARAEDRPVFLSIGYSSCHWCHVMAREVFADAETAALMNRWFVNVMVDREERPDVDEVYLTAVQLLTGEAGWPASVFLTPEGQPFYGGSYFPPVARGGRPGFASLLRRLHTAWSDEDGVLRREMEAVADRLTGDVREHLAGRGPEVSGEAPGELPPAAAARAELARIGRAYDAEHGGFARPPAFRPKFPSPGALFLLVEAWDAGDEAAGEKVVATLRAMGRGAIHDLLGGGFHRYTVDRRWRVPHFEKMLHDNALLAELYAEAFRRTGDPELARVGRRTLELLVREMRLPDGGFGASLDAESPQPRSGAADGAYYTWTRDEVAAALGPDGLTALAPLLGLDGEPEIPAAEGPGRHTLYLDAAAGPAALRPVEPLLDRLAAARSLRPPPELDGKLLADWNGLAIAAFAQAATAYDEPRFLDVARATAEVVLERLRSPGKAGGLLHAAGVPAMLDDYAFLLHGLLALDRASRGETAGGDRSTRWLEAARALADEMETRLRDPAGGYFRAAADPHLPLRAKTVTEGALPSGNAMAVLALVELAAAPGAPEASARYRRRAEAALRAFASAFERSPGSVPGLARALLRHHAHASATEVDPPAAER